MSTANKIVKVPNRVEIAKSFLLSQFKDKTNINKVVEALVEEIQELDDVIVDVQTLRTLNEAKDAQLDEIGAKLKVPRDNLGNEDYRTAIKVKILRSKSAGTENDVAEVIRLLLNDPSASIQRPHPYTVELAAFLGCIGETQSGIRQLSQFIPLNTNTRIISKTNPAFCFEGNVGLGFSSYGGASGGKMSSLVYSNYGVSQKKGYTTQITESPPVVVIDPPYVLSPPVVTGGNLSGDILTSTTGDWFSSVALTYDYQWYRGSLPINGANINTYTITNDDVDSEVSCKVTATNSSGSSARFSNKVLILSSAPPTGGIDLSSLPNYIENNYPYNQTYLTLKSDGTWQSEVAGVVNTGDWLETTGVGAGDNYSCYYTIISGNPLTAPTELSVLTLNEDVIFLQNIDTEGIVGTTVEITVINDTSGIGATHQVFLGVNYFPSQIT